MLVTQKSCYSVRCGWGRGVEQVGLGEAAGIQCCWRDQQRHSLHWCLTFTKYNRPFICEQSTPSNSSSSVLSVTKNPGRRRFKTFIFSHFCIFWRFMGKTKSVFKIVIIIIGWSSNTTRLLENYRYLIDPLSTSSSSLPEQLNFETPGVMEDDFWRAVTGPRLLVLI